MADPRASAVITSPLLEVTSSVSAALSSLGHHCSAACPAQLSILDAPAWLVRRGSVVGSVALVVLDLSGRSEPVTELARQLRHLNACTHKSRIRLIAHSLAPTLVPAPQ